MSESADTTEAEQEPSAISILLIEDNPGDSRLIREMLDRNDELIKRVHPDETESRKPTITVERRLEDGLETLKTTPVDVILLDLNLPDSRGIETLEAVNGAAQTVPVVVMTGLRDQEVGIQAIQRGAQDFLVKDEVSSPLLVRTIHHAIERARQRRERRERQEQLKSLNNLNRIAHDITHIVITSETRAALEQRVCERLAASDAYRFAWIGTLNPGSSRVTPSASAGAEADYLDDVVITTNDGQTAKGPTGKAIQTGRVQIAEDIETDPAYEPWREDALERGYRSSAAIPVDYGEMLYGVLNIYANSTTAFTGPETAVLARMGEVIGHAIAAIDRREALMSDTVVELEFGVDGVAEPLVELSESAPATIQIERLISGAETLLAYGSATDVDRDEFREAVERADGFADARILSGGGDSFEFEMVTPAAISLFETIATHGGRVAEATIDDGQFRFLVHLPKGRDTRRIIELVRERHTGVTYLAQRTHQREDGHDDASASTAPVLDEQLTKKQRAAIETAYAAGYFDWPRESTGEEIAERMGISPATFNQHLRTAERKFFSSVLE
ncbi:helix-turn-helix domain-containing protein [Halobacteria archaeon AArc-dxtr1]|nr:helix-turn-helix domain-containing protein [Halobacteria archaeon AArc-dxtr1]